MIDLNDIRRKFGEHIVQHPEEKWRIDSAFITVVEHVYKQALVDADVNAPWLTAAHALCTDAGIEPGNIADRIEKLRGAIFKPAGEYAPGSAADLDSVLTEHLKRSVKVEQTLLDIAAGRRQMLTPDECRTLALALGTPAEAQTAGQRALPESRRE